MRLGLMLGYSGPQIKLPLDLVLEAERLGFHAVWTAEAYGSDAVTPLAWLGAHTSRIHLGTAIMQMAARTPAMTAMTAMTLDQLSNQRMILGLGLSGPQVVEGWHGQPYAGPIGRTREYIQLLRSIFARQEPAHLQGRYYQIPYQGPDATGLGKPLKSILHGRPDLPIYLAAIGPQNVALAAELADGWLPIFFSPRHYAELFQSSVEDGLRRSAKTSAGTTGATNDEFDIAPSVPIVVGENVAACRNRLKPLLALYIGGMGPRHNNFYHNLASRYGYSTAADTIQDLYLRGQKQKAAAAVPDDLVDSISLCGPRSRIAEQLHRWRDSPVRTLNLMLADEQALHIMAELVL